MPFIHIEALEGLTDEQKQKIVDEMIATFHRVANISDDRIFIFFQDLKKNNYAKQGKLLINHED